MSRTQKEELVTIANPAFAGIDTLPRKLDIAKRYGVSPRTVDRWIAERKIPFLKFGHRTLRFRWSDVEKSLDRFVIREVR